MRADLFLSVYTSAAAAKNAHVIYLCVVSYVYLQMNAEDKNGFIVAECRVSPACSRPPRSLWVKVSLILFQGPAARISQDLARTFCTWIYLSEAQCGAPAD